MKTTLQPAPVRVAQGHYHWTDPQGNKWSIIQMPPSGFWFFERHDRTFKSGGDVTRWEAQRALLAHVQGVA